MIVPIKNRLHVQRIKSNAVCTSVSLAQYEDVNMKYPIIIIAKIIVEKKNPFKNVCIFPPIYLFEKLNVLPILKS